MVSKCMSRINRNRKIRRDGGWRDEEGGAEKGTEKAGRGRAGAEKRGGRGSREGGKDPDEGRGGKGKRTEGEAGRGVASSKTIIVFPIQFPSIAVPGASAPCWPIHRPELRAALSGQPLPDPLALERPRRPSAGRGSSSL